MQRHNHCRDEGLPSPSSCNLHGPSLLGLYSSWYCCAYMSDSKAMSLLCHSAHGNPLNTISAPSCRGWTEQLASGNLPSGCMLPMKPRDWDAPLSTSLLLYTRIAAAAGLRTAQHGSDSQIAPWKHWF